MPSFLHWANGSNSIYLKPQRGLSRVFGGCFQTVFMACCYNRIDILAVCIKLSAFACLANSTTEPPSHPLPPKRQSIQLVYWRQPGCSFFFFFFCAANGQTLSHLERGRASGLFKQVAAVPAEHTLLTFLTMLSILLSTTSFQRSCSGAHFT